MFSEKHTNAKQHRCVHLFHLFVFTVDYTARVQRIRNSGIVRFACRSHNYRRIRSDTRTIVNRQSGSIRKIVEQSVIVRFVDNNRKTRPNGAATETFTNGFHSFPCPRLAENHRKHTEKRKYIHFRQIPRTPCK